MGNKILRVIERVLCVSVCCCKKWSKEPLKRGRRRRTFLYLEKLPKNTTPTYKRGKKTSSSSFYLPSQNLTLALFALAVFTHALLRRRFDRDHFFESFDDDVCSFSGLNVRCWFFWEMFLFSFFLFFFHQHSSYNSRVVNNCIIIIISITRRRDDNHDGHRR